MEEIYLKTMLKALAEKIDRLEAEIYIKNLKNNEMELVIANLKKENEKLKGDVKFSMDELKAEEVKDA